MSPGAQQSHYATGTCINYTTFITMIYDIALILSSNISSNRILRGCLAANVSMMFSTDTEMVRWTIIRAKPFNDPLSSSNSLTF